MIIVNKQADFSNCGIGKIAYKVEDDVKALLDTCFSGLSYEYKFAFQQFITSIGGLNGEIYQKIKRLVVPVFAKTAKEVYTDLITKSVFSSGGGTYATYESALIINRGVGCIYTDAVNINSMNYGAQNWFDDGTVMTSLVVNGLTSVKKPLLSPFNVITYNDVWSIATNSGTSFQNIENNQGHCYTFNVGLTIEDVSCYVDGKKNVLPWLHSDNNVSTLDLSKVLSQKSKGFGIVPTNNNLVIKMWIVSKGLSDKQASILNKALVEFYDAF